MADIIKWISEDWRQIVYGVATSLVVGISLLWMGGFKALLSKWRLARALEAYRKTLHTESSFLPVIGRKSGFNLNEVFVPLDVLQVTSGELKLRTKFPSNTFVLLGGPGAGKSTFVKHIVIERLATGRSFPFFARLREYTAPEAIEQILLNQLRRLNVPHPEELLERELRHPEAMCILDGFDEVRPSLKERLSIEINSFFQKYFAREKEKKLIVTCRKEAYRNVPLDLPEVWEVCPLTDEQIHEFAQKWPLRYPVSKTAETFLQDLSANPRIFELARSGSRG